ncbi:MAG: hypothetical protein ABW200_00120 [Hyphomicrobiaceae bacterium]|jgi:hypothetical protein
MIGTRPQPLVCPDCGLEFVVVHTREGLALYYEFRDWDDACWRSRSGTAGLCQFTSLLNLLDMSAAAHADGQNAEPPP